MSIDPVYEAIGFRIKDLRQQWFITIGTLSMKTKRPIGSIELGLEPLSIPALYTIAKALHCKVAWLLPEEQPKNEEATECLSSKTVTQ